MNSLNVEKNEYLLQLTSESVWYRDLRTINKAFALFSFLNFVCSLDLDRIAKMSDCFSSQLLRDLENSLTQSEDEEISTNLNYRMIPGLRTNSELLWAYEQQQLYYKNAYSTKTQITSYTCRIKGCNARVFVKPDGSAFQDPLNTHLISHGSQYQEYKLMYCDNEMKERAKAAPGSMTPYEIYMEVVAE